MVAFAPLVWTTAPSYGLVLFGPILTVFALDLGKYLAYDFHPSFTARLGFYACFLGNDGTRTAKMENSGAEYFPKIWFFCDRKI